MTTRTDNELYNTIMEALESMARGDDDCRTYGNAMTGDGDTTADPIDAAWGQARRTIAGEYRATRFNPLA